MRDWTGGSLSDDVALLAVEVVSVEARQIDVRDGSLTVES